MLSKNQLKHITSLQQKKYRELFGEFVAEGEKSLSELLGSTIQIKEIFALDAWINENAELLNKQALKVLGISTEELARISTLKTPNKVVAVAAIPQASELSPDMFSDLVLALDNIRDPGNLGTIIRTADWFGIRHIVCSPGCVDAYNPKVVQSSMGSITRTNLLYMELAGFIRAAPTGMVTYGCLLDGSDIQAIPLKTPAIIIIGNESNGISDELLPLISEKLRIPSFPKVHADSVHAESLNASLANAIVCYEFRRRQTIN
jgi:RNA methyltransferase, TrmH family